MAGLHKDLKKRNEVARNWHLQLVRTDLWHFSWMYFLGLHCAADDGERISVSRALKHPSVAYSLCARHRGLGRPRLEDKKCFKALLRKNLRLFIHPLPGNPRGFAPLSHAQDTFSP